MYSGHFPGFQGLFFGISSWRPGIRRLSRGIRRFSRRWDQRLFFPHPRRHLACYTRAQYFWRRGFMRARRRKPFVREGSAKAERQEVHSTLVPPSRSRRAHCPPSQARLLAFSVRQAGDLPSCRSVFVNTMMPIEESSGNRDRGPSRRGMGGVDGWMHACMGTMQHHQRTVVCFVVLSVPFSAAL